MRPLRLRRARVLTGALLVAVPLAASAADLTTDAGPDLGRRVFTQIAQPSCAVCHTLKDTAATGTLGPDLNELKPDKARVLIAVRNGLGVMPPYETQLTPEQIDAVAEFVAKATGAAK